MPSSTEFRPRPYQRQAIERMLGSDIQLVALRMGYGKTGVTLTVLADLLHNRFEVSKVLIVAPLRVAELVWAQEAAKWHHTTYLRFERLLGPSKARREALARPADICVINVENLPWLVEEFSGQPWPFDCVVLDENKGLKDRGSATFKALKSIRQQVKRMYLLTGTPTPNGYMALWPQISILDQGKRLGSGIGKYRDRWFTPGRAKGHVVYNWKIKPGAEAEIQAAVADIMFTVEGGVELPERVDNILQVSVDLTRYRELHDTLVSGEVSAANAAVLAGKLAQYANGAIYTDDGQVEEIHQAKLQVLGEVIEQGEPVLVFTTFRHDQRRILQAFPQARVFDGESSLAAWKRGEVSVLVMHPASGGHGVDGLQAGGHTAVWFGLPFSLELYEQANARLHRSGQVSQVCVHHIVAADTIDEQILKVLQSKGDVQRALLQALTLEPMETTL